MFRRRLRKGAVIQVVVTDDDVVTAFVDGKPFPVELATPPEWGHWHHVQIGPEDENGMAEFEATPIRGGKVCDDCATLRRFGEEY